MFGFLKQKIADFGTKLKETIKKEEVKEPTKEVFTKQEEKKAPQKEDSLFEKKETKPIEKEETKKVEKPKIEDGNSQKVQNKETQKAELTKKEETTKPTENKPKEKELEIKKEPTTFEEETKIVKEERKVEETKEKEEEKKVGILGKLLGFGKKKENKSKPETNIKTETKKAKTKEEVAGELEAKMFAEIDAELKTDKTVEEEIKEEEIETEKAKEEIRVKPKKTSTENKIEEEKVVVKETPVQKETKVLDKIEEEVKEKEENEEQIKIEEKEKPRDIKIKSVEEDKRELKANVGVVGGLKGFLFGGVELTEKQIEDMLFELELSLIESDVEADAASELVKQIKTRLVGSKVSTKNIDEYLREQIKEILADMMKTEKINVLELVKQSKKEGHPLKILMIGPNGAGKTTSIAKLVNYFQKNNLTAIVAAGDTFRAGAIDQIEEHAKRLNIRVIKQQYGADPAAVAFDAIKAAEAGKIDVVLIDSAGRQETNKNLMEELRKIERVAKPDLKIYVGEAYVGQTLLEQVNEFSEIIGIDGFILTKIDTDAKGGTAISLLYKTKKPIIFVGTGQGYDDFKEFTPEFIVERII